MNQKIRFNDGWEFAKSDLSVQNCGNLRFQPVDLPHDWLIENTENLYEDSIGWYRRKYAYHADGNRILLAMDGVYMDCALYVNRAAAGEWKYGYSSFEWDLTDALREGENEILVKVVFRSPNSRWYTGAGIYRNVWLKTQGPSHFAANGIYVSTAQEKSGWRVDVDAELDAASDVRIAHRILYRGRTVAETEASVHGPGKSLCSAQTLHVKKPHLWSPDQPSLYRLVSVLYTGSRTEKPVETVTQNIGFRHIEFLPDAGLRLNGRFLKLHGVCNHHDLGALGSALNVCALKRRLALLKAMGVNALRTSHNMPSPELMDLADQMGFLVDCEAFDVWERPKTPCDYARFFREWFPKDVKSWVTRDRNHPSLLMWSIGNEIYDTHADAERGLAITRALTDCVRRYDPRRNGRITFASNYMPWENTQICADVLKLPGYNYGEKYYEKHHAAHPDWTIYGSETCATVQSRGIYHFPLEKSILGDDDEQCSSLGNSTVSFGAKSTEACICADRDVPFSCGQFVWSGFDYIGEPTPYHTKNSYFGQIDTATFPKDSYFVFQAEWTDYRTHPMIHIFPYWDFNEGQMIDVCVCSNAPKVALKFSGRTVGSCGINHIRGKRLVAHWKIPYAPGTLEAEAFDETGRKIASDRKTSFGDAAAICLTPDRTAISANGTDLIFVEISMTDAAGHAVENAVNRVHVTVTGAGRLVGLDNGDSTDYDQYKGVSRRLFGGRLMAIVAALAEPGVIRMEVSSPGIKSCAAEFTALPLRSGETVCGSVFPRCRERICLTGRADEIPLRKIEIVSPDGRKLCAQKRELTVRAVLRPDNTSYREVEWSVVMDGGIPCPYAAIESCGLSAKVTALGDGGFRIRCMSRNGTDKIRLISELECTADGLGSACRNPYQFVCAGLCDETWGDVTNGNERGIATARDGESRIVFRSLDFGPYGSDCITLSIFALSGAKYPIEIWEGMPGEEGSRLIDRVIYQKPCRWDVYQEETYRLPERLRGITSLCLVLRDKVHIKGFSFQKRNRAFLRNEAAENDSVYGDNFQVRGTCVESIGNNVSLVFEDMDFQRDGADRLVICGRSEQDRNTIQIRFSGPDSEEVRMVEFARAEEYTERTFPLQPVPGKRRVTFLFLPGCRFDFGWFRFEKGSRAQAPET